VASSEPLSIRQLEVFVALIERGSFTKAAKSLHLSQSTVSGHIADLERRLGVRLVERERSGVRPTAAGEALLMPARDVLHAEVAARMAVEELTGLLGGTLQVGGSTIPASYLLPKLFARFHERHPGVCLELVTGDSAEVLGRVTRSEISIGVVGAAPKGKELFSRVIGGDRLVLVVSASHPSAGRASWQAADLTECAFVMRERGSGTRSAVDAALAGLIGPDQLGRIDVACEVGSNEALKAAVRSGLGVAFASGLAVADELAAGNLVAPKLKGLDIRREFFLVCRREGLLSPAARAFRDLALKG